MALLRMMPITHLKLKKLKDRKDAKTGQVASKKRYY